MRSQAGYDIGKEIGNMMEHVFISKPAKIISKTGQLLGILLLTGGFLVMLLDYGMELFGGEFILPSFLVAVGGILLLLLLHWIALQIDKKHIPQK